MRNTFISIFISAFFLACGPEKKTGEDVLRKMKEDEFLDKRLEELSIDAMKRDTATNKFSPVKITESRVNKDYNGQFKPEVFIEFRNDSPDTVDGIRIRVHCFNNFDEPVGGRLNNTFNTEFQETYKPGERASGLFTVRDKDGLTKAFGAVTEVHFTNGRRWTIDSIKGK